MSGTRGSVQEKPTSPNDHGEEFGGQNVSTVLPFLETNTTELLKFEYLARGLLDDFKKSALYRDEHEVDDNKVLLIITVALSDIYRGPTDRHEALQEIIGPITEGDLPEDILREYLTQSRERQARYEAAYKDSTDELIDDDFLGKVTGRPNPGSEDDSDYYVANSRYEVDPKTGQGKTVSNAGAPAWKMQLLPERNANVAARQEAIAQIPELSMGILLSKLNRLGAVF